MGDQDGRPGLDGDDAVALHVQQVFDQGLAHSKEGDMEDSRMRMLETGLGGSLDIGRSG